MVPKNWPLFLGDPKKESSSQKAHRPHLGPEVGPLRPCFARAHFRQPARHCHGAHLLQPGRAQVGRRRQAAPPGTRAGEVPDVPVAFRFPGARMEKRSASLEILGYFPLGKKVLEKRSIISYTFHGRPRSS